MFGSGMFGQVQEPCHRHGVPVHAKALSVSIVAGVAAVFSFVSWLLATGLE